MPQNKDHAFYSFFPMPYFQYQRRKVDEGWDFSGHQVFLALRWSLRSFF
jgi:hypothetical protein